MKNSEVLKQTSNQAGLWFKQLLHGHPYWGVG
jgi:hypothetical protein